MSEIVTTDLVDRLRQRATAARDEGNATALGDALNFEGAAHEIDRLLVVNAELVAALDSIAIYGTDTLSGRADGGPDDRAWQRDAVLTMSRRARAALAKARGDQ